MTGASFRSRVLLLAATLLSSLLVSAAAGASEPAQQLKPIDGFHPLIALEPGASGTPVVRLQYALRQQGFYRGPVDGEYGPATATAVIGFQKYLGLDRTGEFRALDWIRLAQLPGSGVPYRWDEPDRLEIDLGRQLIFLVQDHEVVAVLPTSTGSGETYYSVRNRRHVTADTPEGDFHLRWHETGWNCDRVTGWCVYNYWAFTPFYGIHGYPEVPTYPASHGCSRLHTWDSDWLDAHLYVGMPVHVWRQPPPHSLPPPAPARQAL